MTKMGLLAAAIALLLLGCNPSFERSTRESEKPLETSDQPLKKRQAKTQSASGSDSKPAEKNKVILNVPLIKQNPELPFGCEVTSLAMMLQYAGADTNKMSLFKEIKKDHEPIVKSPSGDIKKWGDPAEGFVGDMTGESPGYAVFDQPMVNLINRHMPGRAVNLTNRSFDEILKHLSKNKPVVIWTTGDYRLPDRWESWKHKDETVKTPLDLHVVVLVGYDDRFVYINDPLSGKKQTKVNKYQFISSWKSLKQRAVSYK